jgi:serine/threonine protein kinase
MTDRLATTATSEPAGAVSAEWPVVPGYEVLQELGRGGMGVVYRANQVSLKRPVALKLIRDGALASPQQRGRFRIEAEAAARMRHANIVAIYEVGEHQGRPYFSMELVEGPSLDKYLSGQPQPAREAAELLRTLALAVQHAHAQCVVHRDLKPANILLQRSEVRGQRSEVKAAASSDLCLLTSDFCPKVTDFGLAKRLDSESVGWTQEGAVVGTPGYMAPEQAAGRVGEIGPAVDVYALGAILYELLIGRPPFLADSWQQTIEQVLHEEPEPPARLRPDVPTDLETICLKCLEKEPARRYAGAGELADDLGRFLDGRPVAAVPLGARERLARLAAGDGYQLADEIGRGPRSSVYRARSGALPLPVALKVFRARLCNRDEWEARLRRDAELWAGLAHPQIVPVQRAGWWDGSVYLAMEYVPHGSLADRLAGRPSPVREALKLVERLAEIVRYLHRQGVVHGNLKPSNVLFAADGIPRVSDFRPTGGLFLGPLPADGPEPTGLGYLAPELVREPEAAPRFHTDVYGLGLILYELLTGRPPFAGPTVRETLEQVQSQDPVPPSRFNSQVTPELERVCLRCLRKDPWRRFSRAFDLVTRLQSLQDDLGGLDAQGKQGHRSRPPGKRDESQGQAKAQGDTTPDRPRE